jgi:hypothetical protein
MKTLVFENLMRHPLDVIDANGNKITIPPSGRIVRSNSARRSIGTVAYGDKEIPICNIIYNKIKLPPETQGVGLIVSAIIANEILRNGEQRSDLYSPDQSVRDPRSGEVIGCKGLIKW